MLNILYSHFCQIENIMPGLIFEARCTDFGHDPSIIPPLYPSALTSSWRLDPQDISTIYPYILTSWVQIADRPNLQRNYLRIWNLCTSEYPSSTESHRIAPLSLLYLVNNATCPCKERCFLFQADFPLSEPS